MFIGLYISDIHEVSSLKQETAALKLSFESVKFESQTEAYKAYSLATDQSKALVKRVEKLETDLEFCRVNLFDRVSNLEKRKK